MIKDLLFFVLSFFSSGLKQKASILMYHSIGDDDSFFTVSQHNFDRQLAYLKAGNFKVLFLSHMLRKQLHGEDISNCVCITFDDGYENNYSMAFPILKKYGFPATIFISTDFKHKKLEMLSRNHMNEISESGFVEFMPHTRHHFVLTELPLQEAVREIEDARKDVEDMMHTGARVLAYPKGLYNDEIVLYLKGAGWLGAVTVKEGLVSRDSDLFVLPRNAVDSKTSFVQFKGKVSGAIERYNALKKWIS